MNLESIIQREVYQKEKNKYINAYIWNLARWYWYTYWAGEDNGMKGESSMKTYILPYVIWWFAIWLSELKLGLCDNLEGWDGMESGREVQEGGDMYVPMADWCWCMARTNTIL